MTLTTRCRVIGNITKGDAQKIHLKLTDLVGGNESTDISVCNTENNGRTWHNEAGQGLHALCWTAFNPNTFDKDDGDFEVELNEDRPADGLSFYDAYPGTRPPSAANVEFSMDTPYGYRGEDNGRVGGGCSDLHAYLIKMMAAYCVGQRGWELHWLDEYNGVWHHYDGTFLATGEGYTNGQTVWGEPKLGKPFDASIPDDISTLI